MNYAEFKDYVITHLWKQGDSVVIDNLDTIIRTAHVELDRALREMPDREEIAILSVDANPYPLPDDCKRVRHISSPTRGGMMYISPKEYAMRSTQKKAWANYKYFTTAGGFLRFLGDIDPTKPVDYELLYEKKIPDFQATDQSWVVDNYLDVYLYCVLKHSAPFLREDERIALWGDMYGKAILLAIEEGADRKFTGAPIKQQFSPNIR